MKLPALGDLDNQMRRLCAAPGGERLVALGPLASLALGPPRKSQPALARGIEVFGPQCPHGGLVGSELADTLDLPDLGLGFTLDRRRCESTPW